MQTSEVQRILSRFGFNPGPVDGTYGPMTATGVARFQTACALYGHNLVVDGIPGPKSWAALQEMNDTGRLSSNFFVSELRSRPRPGMPKNDSCWIHRDLLAALEVLRHHVGRPLAIISGYRTEMHNRAVGGATSSQHTYGAAPELQRISGRLARGVRPAAGRAADFNSGYISLDDCVNLRIFSGIGHRNGQVTHVDARTNGSPNNPTVWRYR